MSYETEARRVADHLRRRLRLHGRADTWVSTKVLREELRALLDHYDQLHGRHVGSRVLTEQLAGHEDWRVNAEAWRIAAEEFLRERDEARSERDALRASYRQALDSLCIAEKQFAAERDALRAEGERQRVPRACPDYQHCDTHCPTGTHA